MSDSSSSSSSEEVSDDDDSYYGPNGEDNFLADLQRIRENDPSVTHLKVSTALAYVHTMTDEDWEQLGRDVSNNGHLKKIKFVIALDDHNTTSFFRGLTRSSSIEEVILNTNSYGFSGVQSMVPFLQNANNLLTLDFFHDEIQSDSFNLLFRSLRDSSIKRLTFHCCGLSSIKIDVAYVPNCLKILNLSGNEINADGCRGLAKLLRRENATLRHLFLDRNQIDDEGISILANALRTNTSLILMTLQNNEGITIEGMKLVLKLLNDISSIKATLQSNHTLFSMTFNDSFENTDVATEIKRVLEMNKTYLYNPANGKLKVILTQLDSKVRSEMCSLQGLVGHTKAPLTDLGPLLLPEVLELVGEHHGLSKFYESFREAASDIWTTINREAVLHQKRAELAEELDVLVAKRREVESQLKDVDIEIASIGKQSHHAACDGSHKSKRQKIS
eukprot:scaffold5316_cov90-Skeletonema_dohrnii-CCMP3373.AAC.8